MAKARYENETPLFLITLHGRKTLTENLDDWGPDGPVVGPFVAFHVTYGSSLYLVDAEGSDYELVFEGDCLKVGDMLYGDWEITGNEPKHKADIMSCEAAFPSRMEGLATNGAAKQRVGTKKVKKNPKVIVFSADDMQTMTTQQMVDRITLARKPTKS